MARQMLFHAISDRKFEIIAVLRTYRRICEQLNDQEVPKFEHALIVVTAAATAHPRMPCAGS
jgi:hypothetical protein